MNQAREYVQFRGSDRVLYRIPAAELVKFAVAADDDPTPDPSPSPSPQPVRPGCASTEDTGMQGCPG